MEKTTYFAATETGSTPYHLRRLNYLNNLSWDSETQFLAVYVEGREVEFDYWSDGSIIHLIKQPKIGSRVELVVENITFLD